MMTNEQNAETQRRLDLIVDQMRGVCLLPLREAMDAWGQWEHVARIRSQEIAALKAEKGACLWQEDDGGNWMSDCGKIYTLNEGTPLENQMKYCCYCGRNLGESPFKEETDEDA